MLIFFLTDQSEICHIISDRLAEHSCHVFTDINKIYDAILNLHNPPDLLVVDYSMFNHEIFSISEYMDQVHYHIPIIYYNDPCLIAGNRPDHWKHLLFLQNDLLESKNQDEYYDVFVKITEVVEDPDISQYIPLMQKPKMLPEKFYVTKMYKDTVLKDAQRRLMEFKTKTNMPDNLFFLMELLYIYLDKTVSAEELRDEYSQKIRPITIQSITVQLSKLKKILKDYPEANYTIIKRKTGYQLIAF